jgi:hypothetical protein
MLYYTNTFRGLTTIVLEIEDCSPIDQIMRDVKQQLDPLGAGCHCETYIGAEYIENRYDEDVVKVWKFTIMSAQNESCIQSVIDDICELVIEATR